MSENKSGWGGKRANQTGRPKRTEEQEIINLFDKSIDRDLVVTKLNDLIKKGDIKAITLYLSYVYGKPVNKIDQTTDLSFSGIIWNEEPLNEDDDIDL